MQAQKEAKTNGQIIDVEAVEVVESKEDKVKRLKAEAYDLIAAFEQMNAQAGEIRKMLEAKNAEIQQVVNEE